jgi:uncharacterized membrane protein
MELIQRIFHAITQVHPLHTLLVHFPIALTSAAFFFILLAVLRKSDILEKVAFANISLAAVSTIVTGAAGYMDNLKYYNGNATNYKAKIVLAIILFLVTSLIAIIRWRNPELFHNRKTKLIYVLAYFVSFVLVSVLGFLGGVIVYGM